MDMPCRSNPQQGNFSLPNDVQQPLYILDEL